MLPSDAVVAAVAMVAPPTMTKYDEVVKCRTDNFSLPLGGTIISCLKAYANGVAKG